MARATHRLSARGASALSSPGLHPDGNGLYLNITKSGAKSWRLICRYAGKRCEVGLGTFPPVTLAEARTRAANLKKGASDGLDPRSKKVSPSQPGVMTFGTVATELIDTLEVGWRNPKHRQQWRNTLTTYAAPIWEKDVALVDTNDLLGILTPIWSAKPETASRVRARIERVLDAAKVRGLRTGENLARWRGHLEVLLPKAKRQGEHHAAMPFCEVPALMTVLRTRPALAARALEFTILTAARTSETLNATWSEMDMAQKLWTVPADRMKAGKIHRVPLSDSALLLLEGLAAASGCRPNSFIFPGAKPGRPLSNMSMEMLLRRMEISHATVHGFRSSFRDWAGEETDYTREVAEAALAHAVGSAVELAYRRGDALLKRQSMMDEWDRYLHSLPKVDEN